MLEGTKTFQPSIKPAPFQFMPTSFKELHDLANIIAKSDLAPKDYKDKPGNCLVAMQMGAEVGLMPMQALQNIAVINGRPSIWGDAAKALVMASPAYELIEEWEEGDFTAGTLLAVCRAKRKDGTATTCTFSIVDATRAGLWRKAGPWTQYPRRMLQMRARGFALRDVFPDVLRGLAIREEAIDLPREKYSVVQITPRNGTAGLYDKLAAINQPEPAQEEPEQNNGPDIDEVIGLIENAQNIDALLEAREMARSLSEAEKEAIRPIYKEKEKSLNSIQQ